jgi:transcriptional regulator of met regulon
VDAIVVAVVGVVDVASHKVKAQKVRKIQIKIPTTLLKILLRVLKVQLIAAADVVAQPVKV